MIPFLKEYEPPHQRLRIRNKVRLLITLLIILCTLFTLVLYRTGKSQTSYIPYSVGYGDTYWDIAEQLQRAGYKPSIDIRKIVHELIEESGIPAHELQEGDTILIPDMGVTR